MGLRSPGMRMREVVVIDVDATRRPWSTQACWDDVGEKEAGEDT